MHTADIEHQKPRGFLDTYDHFSQMWNDQCCIVRMNKAAVIPDVPYILKDKADD